MVRQLILDTSILIAYERGRLDLAAIADADDSVAIAAITIAEFRVGIEQAKTKQQIDGRTRFLATLLKYAQVLDYTAATATHHARLLSFASHQGLRRGAHDLIIAAHAAESGRLLLAADSRAGFDALPDVKVQIIRQ
ncbi:MAG: PIN domain-containing protein [Propionibacteriaceae bacterium]|nr:PIN domain-containing protein [Propionibacteriaceae bacterium]